MPRIASALVVVALIVLVNVGLRLIDLPALNVSLPDFDVPDWLQWANRVKNVLLLALLAAVVIGGIARQARGRDR